MKTFAKNAVFVTMVGASLLSSLPVTASADDFSFGVIIGGGGPPPPHGPRPGFPVDDPGFFNEPPPMGRPPMGRPPMGRPPMDDPDVYVRPPRGMCDPDDAIDIALDYGLRHPRIIGADRRKVVVEGRKGGGRARIIFGNVPGCPVAYR
jgi:hypothetical protein